VSGRFARRIRDWLLPAAVLGGFLVLYAATAQRGVSWQDSGEFQYRVLAGDYLWHSGIARAHPLYIGLARAFAEVFPSDMRVFAATLFSGAGMVLALAFLAAAVWRLTGSRWSAALSVATLGLSHMAWWMSTVAEVYTWSLAALLAEVYCLVRFFESKRPCWLVALFGANGCHAAIHNFAFLNLLVYGVILAAEQRAACRQAGGLGRRYWGQLALMLGCVAAAWLTGAWLLVGQAVADWRIGGDLGATVRSVLFGSGYEQTVLGVGRPIWRLAAANLALAGVSLLNPCWLFALQGWLGAARPGAFPRCLAGLTVVHLAFWIRYFVPDQATFVLPTLGLLAVWVGLGAGEVLKLGSAKGLTFGGARARLCVGVLAVGALCAVSGPWLLSVAVERAGGVEVARSRSLPFRNETCYWLRPWKQNERSAADFVEQVGRTLRAGDILIADSTSAGALLAAREAGLLAGGWRLVTPWSGETDGELRGLIRGGSARTYVVSPVAVYTPRAVLEAAKGFEREGVLYRVAR
jgi:hypothetical protein